MVFGEVSFGTLAAGWRFGFAFCCVVSIAHAFLAEGCGVEVEVFVQIVLLVKEKDGSEADVFECAGACKGNANGCVFLGGKGFRFAHPYRDLGM